MTVNGKSLDSVPMPRITLEPVGWSYMWINRLLYKRGTGAKRPVLLSYVWVKINPKAKPKFQSGLDAGTAGAGPLGQEASSGPTSAKQ